MIRVAQEADFPAVATNEVLVRIIGLRLTYGLDVPFVRYYTDGEGALLAAMDGVGMFHAEHITDEWCVFLAMNPDIETIHCSDSIGHVLVGSGIWQGRAGVTLKYAGELPEMVYENVCVTPYLPRVYELLKDHFPGISSLDYWYPDVSHRVRHGNCHISAVLDGECVVSTAMTVAETATAAVLGQVATHPDFRRRGLAEKCIKSTIFQCKDKELYILPINEYAQKLYVKMGFMVCGGWTELQRT